jgi:hypothetical protein
MGTPDRIGCRHVQIVYKQLFDPLYTRVGRHSLRKFDMNHVFISYVKENRKIVYKLCKYLEKQDITIWLDKNDIAPGTFWKDSIRNAISNGDFYMAFFSKEQNSRNRSYMNEELVLAIEELRRRNYNQVWFIPILLSGEIPDLEIGAGKTLRDLQWIELNEKNWASSSESVLKVIKSITIKKSGIAYADSFDQSIRDILNTAIGSMSQGFKHVFRAYVMLPTADGELEIKYWSTNLFGNPALDVKLQKWQGAPGMVWGYEKGIVGDLSTNKIEHGIDSWGLTDKQRLITENVVSILSIPIRDHKKKNKILGVLTFDSSEPLMDYLSNETSQITANSIALIISALIKYDKEH